MSFTANDEPYEVTVNETNNTAVVALLGTVGPMGPAGPTGASGVVSVTAPVTNSGTSTAAQLGVSAASISAAGVVQLTDSVTSTSTTTAATANSVREAMAEVHERFNGSTTAIDALPRTASITGIATSLGQVFLTFFTPITNLTVTQVSYANGATVSSGLTLCRFGLYTFDGTTATLVARTASDTTLFNTANTVYTRSFATAGGYPSSYDLVAGSRYAAAVIQVGTTGGNVSGISFGPTGIGGASPRVMGVSGSQTDLPTTITSFGADTRALWARLS